MKNEPILMSHSLERGKLKRMSHTPALTKDGKKNVGFSVTRNDIGTPFDASFNMKN